MQNELGAIKQIEKIDIKNNSVEEKVITAYGCQGVKEKRKFETSYLLYATCQLRVQVQIKIQLHTMQQKILPGTRETKRSSQCAVNGHAGILGEKMNKNGAKSLEFAELDGFEILNHTTADDKITWVGNSLPQSPPTCS